MATTKYPKFESAGSPSFDEVWKNYIIPLTGKILCNSKGPNVIIDVNNKGIKRKTCTNNTIDLNNKNINRISRNKFEAAYKQLTDKGILIRTEFDEQFKGRCSSGIILILGAGLPFVKKETKPSLRLILK